MRYSSYLQGLVLFFWTTAIFAGGITTTTDVAQILEDPDITALGDEADIRISFTVPITYLRSFPDGPSAILRVNLEVPDPCVAEQLKVQESKNSPKTNLVTPFVLTFPEIVSKSQTGNAVCSVTQKRVDNKKTLLIKFDTISTYKVRLGEDNHSIIIRVPLRAEPVATFVTPKFTVPEPSSTASAKELLASGKASMAAGEYEGATQTLNRLLNLPPNEYSQEAQELVGSARENNGDFAKAKVEYELYLRLYPQTEGALRVNTRLAAINNGTAKVAGNKFSTKKQINQVNQNTIFGGLSQYYYGGKTLTSTTNAGITTQTRSTDQSALVTSFDITDRWRHNQYDDKFVFRDSQTHNFRPGVIDANRLNAAYWDHEDKALGFMTRLGRQPGNSQGVLGRFDGVFGKYSINDKFRVTALAGVPDNGPHSSIITNRHFYGTALEFGLPSSTVSGNVYAIQQVADNFTERRAVGSELRYFNESTSWFGLLDYDTVFHEVNIALLQGNWTTKNEITFNALLDHRKSPILYGESGLSAVQSAVPLSVGGLRKKLSKQQIYSAIKDITAETDTALIGATKQITPKWQIGGDVRLNRTSGTKGVNLTLITGGANDLVQPSTSTGIAYTYSLQAVGTNVMFADDTTVFNSSYVDDPHYAAQTFGFTNVATFRTKWHVTSSINLYHQKSDSSQLDQSTYKLAPTARLSYQVLDNALLEAELGFEKSYTDDNTNQKTRSTRQSMFVGYRWDF
jgi:tetratricopeptide (TPR) repeat protein